MAIFYGGDRYKSENSRFAGLPSTKVLGPSTTFTSPNATSVHSLLF